jgi:DHA3 family macrolide efflux protein-like MFS transporter
MKTKLLNNSFSAFFVTWFGQVVSLVGSGLTSFALGVWVFERTGSATLFAFIGMFAVLPKVIFSPLAGIFVDRWDRRRVMILSDAGAGLSTLFIAFMLFNNSLALWHIYLAALVSSLFSTFQWPAYSAAVTQLVPKHHLGRANGMIQFGRAAAEIFSPLLAGIFVLIIRLEGVILIDVATFLFAMITLLTVRFPRLDLDSIEDSIAAFIMTNLTYGWRSILTRKGLLNLLIFQALVNFIWGFVGALLLPMVLSFTTPDKLGAIITIAGAGMFGGSLLMTIWGGPKRRVYGVLLFELLSRCCFLLMGFRSDFWAIAIGAFGAHVTIALVFGCNQALWQTLVEPEKQGRVFAARQMYVSMAAPLAYLLAGPLAEKFFEPWMASGGALSSKLSQLLGVGAGRGIGLMFVLMGVIKVSLSAVSYLNPRLRSLEKDVSLG